MVPLKSRSARGLMASMRFTGSPCLQPIPRPVNNLAFSLILQDICEPIVVGYTQTPSSQTAQPASLLIEGLEEGKLTIPTESTCTYVDPAAA